MAKNPLDKQIFDWVFNTPHLSLLKNKWYYVSLDEIQSTFLLLYSENREKMIKLNDKKGFEVVKKFLFSSLQKEISKQSLERDIDIIHLTHVKHEGRTSVANDLSIYTYNMIENMIKSQDERLLPLIDTLPEKQSIYLREMVVDGLMVKELVKKYNSQYVYQAYRRGLDLLFVKLNRTAL